MFVKFAVFACVAVVAFGQHWGGNQGQWNGAQNALDAGQYTGDGDYHGEGLQEAGAFGDVSQNWNDGNNGQWNGGQAGQWNGGDNGQWNGGAQAGQWNGGAQAGQWNGGAQAGAWNGGAQAGAWNGGAQAGAWNGGAHAAAAALPAGVDAHACPNYPFCH
ncbi:hypothetical protein CBL_20592 [Carabus blaptoides fortunei]